MKRDEVFERLDPPSGGLARLRARLATPPRRARRLAPALALAAALAVIVVVVLGRRDAVDPVAEARLRANGAEIALGFAPMPKTPVTVDAASRETTALAEVKTTNPNVAFYWVSSTAWRE